MTLPIWLLLASLFQISESTTSEVLTATVRRSDATPTRSTREEFDSYEDALRAADNSESVRFGGPQLDDYTDDQMIFVLNSNPSGSSSSSSAEEPETQTPLSSQSEGSGDHADVAVVGGQPAKRTADVVTSRTTIRPPAASVTHPPLVATTLVQEVVDDIDDDDSPLILVDGGSTSYDDDMNSFPLEQFRSGTARVLRPQWVTVGRRPDERIRAGKIRIGGANDPVLWLVANTRSRQAALDVVASKRTLKVQKKSHPSGASLSKKVDDLLKTSKRVANRRTKRRSPSFFDSRAKSSEVFDVLPSLDDVIEVRAVQNRPRFGRNTQPSRSNLFDIRSHQQFVFAKRGQRPRSSLARRKRSTNVSSNSSPSRVANLVHRLKTST